MCRQNDKNGIVKSLNVNGVEVTKKKEIADNLTLHFSTVGKELAKNFPNNNNANCLKYLTKVNNEITVLILYMKHKSLS